MKQLFVILVLLTTLISCETYFVPDVDEQKQVYVFEGLITDQQKSHYVIISQTKAFDDNDYFEKVGGFSVNIESASGEVFPLEEKKPGYYLSDSTIQGKIGESYRFVAISPDGKTYRSDFEELTKGAEIKELDAIYEERQVLRYNEYTGFTEEKVNGLQVVVDVDANDYTPFYRYEFEMVIQSQQIYPGETGPIMMYVAYTKKSTSMDLVSVLNGNNYSGNQIINGPTCYIPEDFMGDRKVIGWELDSLGRKMFREDLITHRRAGFLIEIHQYSLSENGYNYWKSIHDQTSSTGQIFDPVQAQIIGNVNCITHEQEIAFGYFGASAITKNSRFMNYAYPDIAKVKPVVYFPQIDTITWSEQPFDFWVY